MTSCITLSGDDSPGGVYILWLGVHRDLALAFGRFQTGRPIAIPAGNYAYVGSALSRRGATSLAGRLLRHATRGGGRPPHAIRDELAARLAKVGLRPAAGPLPADKRLRWHVDYLLEELAVEIGHISILRTAERAESRVADWLAAQPGAWPPAAGLGASDDRGRTHLWRVPALADFHT